MLSNFVFSDNISLFVLVFCVFLFVVGNILSIYVYRLLRKTRTKKAEDLPDHFDGIVEENNPTPMGLHIVMIGTVVFSIWYITVGILFFSFDQAVQYETEVKAYNEQFNKKWQNMDDAMVLEMGESIFNTQCVTCHGFNAEGINGRAANLIEYGNEDHIIYVIKHGSTGLNKLTPAMTPQYATLGDTEEARAKAAKDVAAYVITLSGRKPVNGGDIQAGKTVFMRTCFACHGPSGKGMGPEENIPNFAADLTRYGTPNYIKDIIKQGKNGYIGQMPAFEKLDTLSEVQYDAIAKYVVTQLN